MRKIGIGMLLVLSISCQKGKNVSDASGTFEADEIIVSAESNGAILSMNIEEGQLLEMQTCYGYIDSIQLYLKKKQLLAQRKVILSKRPNINTQLSALYAQLNQAKHEKARIDALFEGKAATGKQRDDAAAAVDVLQKQINGMESSLSINTNSLNEEITPLIVQIEQLDDQLNKCKIMNPVKGTVLIRYANVGEMAVMGKPLYKLADLDKMYLRAYVTGDQYANLKLGSELQVKVDDGKGGFKSYKGQLSWISPKAEFTPKTIQTKDERANLVYAVKVKVKNDGFLKSGMYGELMF